MLLKRTENIKHFLGNFPQITKFQKLQIWGAVEGVLEGSLDFVGTRLVPSLLVVYNFVSFILDHFWIDFPPIRRPSVQNISREPRTPSPKEFYLLRPRAELCRRKFKSDPCPAGAQGVLMVCALSPPLPKYQQKYTKEAKYRNYIKYKYINI